MITRDRMATTERMLMTVTAVEGTGPAEPEVWITSSALDRMKDRVRPDGAVVDNFLKNPQVNYGHQRDAQGALPVATATVLRRVGDRWRMRWRWLENDPFADRVRNAWDQGVLRAASIEFIPLASEPNAEGGTDYTRWELVGVALCAVPANPEAVRMCKALGLPVGEWRDASDCPGIGRLGCVNTTSGASCPAEDRCPMFGPAQTSWRGEPIILLEDDGPEYVLVLDEEKVVPSNISTDREDSDAAWSAPALSDFTAKTWSALSDAERERIAKHYAWASEMPPRTFGSLKLPHHNPRTGKVNLHGVNNALARLPNTDIPASEKGRVEAHLKAHQEAFKGFYKTASGGLRGIGPDGRELTKQEVQAVIGALLLDPNMQTDIVDQAEERIQATIGRLRGDPDFCASRIVPRGRR